MKEYKIIKIDNQNYPMFDDMVFWRINGKQRTYSEKSEVANNNFSDVYVALTNSNLYVYAALDNDKFVGWISIIYMPKVGRLNGLGHLYIDELWVEPTYRKQNIANRLLEKADELLNTTESVGVRLYVNTENLSAKKLYVKCGFSESGTAYFMEKTEYHTVQN
ncbi:GNAT family N-acetyltransferase [Clostridium estertheticum]|uniref:GNAT family N-acetyltransferase n=1 Tax=Clostridium estertheticum TaxID=238834 RepID=UPI0013E92B30|nr:GNAT family N-acetyltransferase [Clostridium estertheticum]MBZ9689697.1 GNAT family N-acetyltransferase [Clostridium estertheticum]